MDRMVRQVDNRDDIVRWPGEYNRLDHP